MKIQDIDMRAIDKAIQSLKGEREDNDQFNAGMYYIRDLIEPYYDNLVKENKRLNNIIDELHILFIEFDRNVVRRKYVDANIINLEIKAKLKELKEGK